MSEPRRGHRAIPLALLAVSAGGLLLDRLTMLTVIADSSHGTFGFPFMAFEASHVTSLEVMVFWGPLLADWLCYTLAVLPLAWVATRRLPPRSLRAVAVLTLFAFLFDVSVQKLALGVIDVRSTWRDPYRESATVVQRCPYLSVGGAGRLGSTRRRCSDL